MDNQETAEFRTPSGLDMKRAYGPAEAPPREDVPPGEFPFTRGIHPTMHRGRLWTMRQYAGFGTASETNKRFRWLLAQGQTGLSTAFDLPTQIGLDADDPKAKGEVGRVGVHVGTIDDMEELFKEIPQDKISTSLTINATAPVLLAFYVAVAKRRGLDPAVLRGTLQNDILKEYIARGTYIYPIGAGLRLSVDAIEYSARRLPSWNPVSISGYHMREAGATAVQEAAFTFANAEVYVRETLARGLALDEFAPKLAFFFGCHNHFLEEIAKFRAARRLWARLMKDDFGARDPRSMALRFHVQTCGSTLTSGQPVNNAMRVAFQALAAVLGGCQSLHTNAYDEALALPSEEAAHLALRTQQILAFETGVADSADPTAGAYAIEELTDRLEAGMRETLGRVREAGGMLEAIARGLPQAEIQEAAYKAQKDVEDGRRGVVGVNCLTQGRSRKPKAILKVSPSVERSQVRRLARFRRSRGTAYKSALARLREAARGRDNLMPLILDCAQARATLGEICGALREEFGEYKA